MLKPKLIGLLVALFLLGLPTAGDAAEIVKLEVGFSPDRAGASTTVLFGFDITTTNGMVPSPLTNLDVQLPVGVGLGNLGLATCTPPALERAGPQGCSPNSLMGIGNAVAEVPIATENLFETVTVWTFLATPHDEHTDLLFYAEGSSPVASSVIFHGTLLPSAGQFGASLNTVIPITPSVPEAPDVAVIHMRSRLGPEGLHYYRFANGRSIRYRPEGMTLPKQCPANGFPFAATFTFQDGTTATSTATVPCPVHGRRSHRQHMTHRKRR
jgi:hypothetical protein